MDRGWKLVFPKGGEEGEEGGGRGGREREKGEMRERERGRREEGGRRGGREREREREEGSRTVAASSPYGLSKSCSTTESKPLVHLSPLGSLSVSLDESQ